MTCVELLGRGDNGLLGLELALPESNKAAVNGCGLALEVEAKGGADDDPRQPGRRRWWKMPDVVV